MVRDQFRLDKDSKWKRHIGAVVTLLVISFYYNRLSVLQLKDISVDKDQISNSKGKVIAQFLLNGEFSLSFIHPASFPNRLTCSLLCVWSNFYGTAIYLHIRFNVKVHIYGRNCFSVGNFPK
jgi:hypothetical protein